jgi:hypothetical protein
MKNLQEYLAQKNSWNSLVGMPALDLNSAKDRKAIAQGIDSELSPENLHCDGEISQAQAMKKLRRLHKCAAQLKQLDPTVKFYEY